MKPYYQDNAVTIYLGDCRDIAPTLGKFDMLLTDPPYGMNYKSNRREKHAQLGGIAGDDQFPHWVFDYSGTHASFVFCRWDNLTELPAPKSFIVWDKGRHSMGDLEHEYGRQWEGIAFYPGALHGFTRRPADIIRLPCVPSSALLHPNEKPAGLITNLLGHTKGETILDPFAGSGTTGRAAKDMGKTATLIELDEKYCEIAARRMSQEVFPL